MGIDVSELEEHVFGPKKTFIKFLSDGIRIELLCAIPGDFTYHDAEKAARLAEMNGQIIKVIGYDHLIRNKIATNRPIDRLDVDELRKRNE